MYAQTVSFPENIVFVHTCSRKIRRNAPGVLSRVQGCYEIAGGLRTLGRYGASLEYIRRSSSLDAKNLKKLAMRGYVSILAFFASRWNAD